MTTGYDNFRGRPGAGGYAPMRRPGMTKPWPPDDSWTIAELASELQFWRNLSALQRYAQSDPELRISPFIQSLPAVVPAPRKPADPRWDHLMQAGLEAYRRQERRKRQRGHL